MCAGQGAGSACFPKTTWNQREQEATRNKCIATSNKCLTSSNKKLLVKKGIATRKDATSNKGIRSRQKLGKIPDVLCSSHMVPQRGRHDGLPGGFGRESLYGCSPGRTKNKINSLLALLMEAFSIERSALESTAKAIRVWTTKQLQPTAMASNIEAMASNLLATSSHCYRVEGVDGRSSLCLAGTPCPRKANFLWMGGIASSINSILS